MGFLFAKGGQKRRTSNNCECCIKKRDRFVHIVTQSI